MMSVISDLSSSMGQILLAPNVVTSIDSAGSAPFLPEAPSTHSNCFTNCSGHGLCHHGECWCEVQFRGTVCQANNFVYYSVFSCLFFLLSITSLVQLAVCIQAEYHKHEKPCLRDALRLTNQKLVYIFVTVATASRGFYFAIQLSHPVISFNLQTVYYPLVLTIFSLIVCFWGESFHIKDLITPSPFLTKSAGAFIAFNVILYILLFIQLLATNTWVTDLAGKQYWMRISKACFASLTLLVVVFFLIYGVEMFFKIRGAFVDANRRPNRFVACSSRLSLIAQAGCLLFLALFLFSDVAFIHFDQKITDLGISYFDTACRAVDLAVALWFPVVLWKSSHPDELWLLNPKLLLKTNPVGVEPIHDNEAPLSDAVGNETNCEKTSDVECWICYDTDRDDAGPLISPCKCKGDVGVVHHECLRRWILESIDDEQNRVCKVCAQPYHVQTTFMIQCQVQNWKLWLRWFCGLSAMTGMPFAVSAVFQATTAPAPRVLALAALFLVEYALWRMAGFNLITLYNYAKFSSLRIEGKVIKPLRKATNHAESPSNPSVSSTFPVSVLHGEKSDAITAACDDVCYYPEKDEEMGIAMCSRTDVNISPPPSYRSMPGSHAASVSSVDSLPGTSYSGGSSGVAIFSTSLSGEQTEIGDIFIVTAAAQYA